jgi:hypothetical protein
MGNHAFTETLSHCLRPLSAECAIAHRIRSVFEGVVKKRRRSETCDWACDRLPFGFVVEPLRLPVLYKYSLSQPCPPHLPRKGGSEEVATVMIVAMYPRRSRSRPGVERMRMKEVEERESEGR